MYSNRVQGCADSRIFPLIVRSYSGLYRHVDEMGAWRDALPSDPDDVALDTCNGALGLARCSLVVVTATGGG